MVCCGDRRRLAEQFAIAAREYSEAVARLVLHQGPPSHAEYSTLRHSVIDAQERCVSVGVEFEQHVAMHGCDLDTKRSRAHVMASAGV
jgi:hypothetical protein